MKIMHVTSYFQPDMGYQENCLSQAQAKLGHEVSILASDRYPPYAGYEDTMQKIAGDRIVREGTQTQGGVEIVRLKCGWEWAKHFWVYLPGLWEEIQRRNPDIIHAHNVITVPTFQVLVGNVKGRYPLVVDDHNNYFNIEPYTLGKKVLYRTFKYALRPLLMGSVARVLPMSHEVQSYLKSELGIAEKMTTMVHLGADAERFRRDVDEGKAVRVELGIPGGAIVIVNAGKITPVKDNHILLEAMANVVRSNDRAWLLMIGNAPEDYRKQLETIVEKRGLSNRVRWIDFVRNEQLPRYYSSANIGVWPGDWSGTVIEAASCSLPLVLPRSDATKYSVSNDNGIVYERGDVEALTDALYLLVSDDNLRETMGQKSRELIEKHLNWDTIAGQTIEIYTECIAGRKAL